MEITKRFKKFRLKQGVSKRRMAKDTGVTWMTITNVEEGKNSPKLETFETMCNYLGLKIVLEDKDGNRI